MFTLIALAKQIRECVGEKPKNYRQPWYRPLALRHRFESREITIGPCILSPARAISLLQADSTLSQLRICLCGTIGKAFACECPRRQKRYFTKKEIVAIKDLAALQLEDRNNEED